MPMRIGIIGAENSHTAAYANLLNVEKLIPGFSVTHVWGETREFAEAAAAKGNIPNIVDDDEAMLGKIDALIVDHRHAKYHLDAALPYVEAGIPTFVDKPFCYRAEKGKAFLETARKHGTPVTSFSSVPLRQSFKKFMAEMESVGDLLSGGSYGSCALENEYGGVFFYGVHQVEMILTAFGYDVEAALVSVGDAGMATANLMYPSGFVANMALVWENAPGFGMDAIGRKGSIHHPIKGDGPAYLDSTKIFTKMFETGEEPKPHEELLAPVRVLEAMERSIQSGTVEKIIA